MFAGSAGWKTGKTSGRGGGVWAPACVYFLNGVSRFFGSFLESGSVARLNDSEKQRSGTKSSAWHGIG